MLVRNILLNGQNVEANNSIDNQDKQKDPQLLIIFN
jgi:hypothetical protein